MGFKCVKEKRGVSFVHLKFGIDGKGGSLKLTLSIQSTSNDSMTDSSRQKYNDGIVSKKFLDSGVTKYLSLVLLRLYRRITRMYLRCGLRLISTQ